DSPLERSASSRAELGWPSADLRGRAAEHLAAGGVRAGERLDYNAAATLLGRATGLLDPVDARRLALLPVLGRVLHALGRFDEAFAAFDEAIERADPYTAAHAFFYKSYVQGHGEARSGYELERDVRDRLS